MKGHITSFFWNLNKKATPFLKIKKENGLEEYVPLKRNKHIQVLNDFGKYCTGYYQNKVFHNCPNNTAITSGRQCKKCASLDEFRTCAQCTGRECNASKEIMQNCLNRTHFIYLTLIGSKIKVGVTRSGRYLKRWIEQGSDYACIIGSGNGLEARRKEHLLAKEVTDRINTSYKIKEFMQDNREIFEDFLREKKLGAPIINVRRYYEGIDSIPSAPSVYNGLLAGRIVCVKGKIIVFEKEDEYYYYNLNDLIAHKVEIKLLKE